VSYIHVYAFIFYLNFHAFTDIRSRGTLKFMRKLYLRLFSELFYFMSSVHKVESSSRSEC
jgi:hypothetical protein